MSSKKFSDDTFFSISFSFLKTDHEIGFDLYINSSKVEGKAKYVRIFPKGEMFSKADLQKLENKFPRVYVHEDQRSFYLQSLVNSKDIEDVEKTAVIKDSAIHYLGKIFDDQTEFSTDYLNESLKGCKESVSNMVDVIKNYNVQSLQGLIGELSYHDFYTYDHSINVSMYCISIYKGVKANATKEELIMAGMGGLLHDLGKTKIPTEIINFTGKLTDEMFDEIKKHPQYGNDLIQDSACSCEGVNMEIIRRVVYEHHENYNGTGYPNKLKGDDIHLMARVTAVADFFDAITTKRSYAEVMSTEDAIHLMASSKGKKIDPRIFEVFARNAQTIIKKNKLTKVIDPNFDPCQPCQVIPYEEIQAVKSPPKETEILVKDFFGNKEKKDKKVS